ncbi:MAG: ABC transporter permease, partial [Gammaproteobacteria bacterium]
MSLVVLKTDLLFFLLVVLALGYAFYASRREHLAAPWRQVARRPLGMSAAVVLAVFVLIALADSCHFRPRIEGGAPGAYAAEVESLLDVIVRPLKENVEKTYSAPFATHAFAKEMIELPDGTTARAYPRLAYGGAHLDDPAARG